MATGAGGCAFKMQPLGAMTRNGSNDPALFGMSDPMMQRSAKTE